MLSKRLKLGDLISQPWHGMKGECEGVLVLRISNNRFVYSCNSTHRASQVASVVQNLLAGAGDTGDAGLIPGSGRSLGGGNGNLLQYSLLENSTDRGTL